MFELNLEKLNEYIKTDHFKMEDLRSAEKLVFRGVFMGTIDLEDAYFLIPIHKNSRKYLQLEFSGILYEFTCLPFGLTVSPFIYTKVLRVVVNYLRSKGLLSVIYMDDMLCLGNNFNECDINLRETIKTLTSLGFLISNKKSNLIPSTRCKYLGFIIDSVKLSIEPTEVKKSNIKSAIDSISKKDK